MSHARSAAIIGYLALLTFLSAPARAAAPGQRVALGDGLELGDAIQVDTVVVWPVFATAPVPKLDGELITLAEAQQRNHAVVRERANGGEVNQLVIQNRGNRPILVLAGTLLKGGNQDRQVGQDFIVPPGRTVPVEAFCVEQGRWTATREGAGTGGRFQARQALAPKAVRAKAQFDADQAGVWQEVARQNAHAGKQPSTGTLLATMEDGDAEARARRDRIVKTVETRLRESRATGMRPIGLAYAIGGAAREVRVFIHPRVFDRFQATLLTTVAVEGDLAARSERGDAATSTIEEQTTHVVELVKDASAAPKARRTTRAGNVNATGKSEKAAAADCFLDNEALRPATRTFMMAD